MSVRATVGAVAALLTPPATYRMTTVALGLASTGWVNTVALMGTASDLAAIAVTVIACALGIRQALDSYQAGKERDRLAAKRAQREDRDDERHHRVLSDLAELKACAELNADLAQQASERAARSAALGAAAARKAVASAASTAAALAELQARLPLPTGTCHMLALIDFLSA
jgi:hypothetical protein